MYSAQSVIRTFYVWTILVTRSVIYHKINTGILPWFNSEQLISRETIWIVSFEIIFQEITSTLLIIKKFFDIIFRVKSFRCLGLGFLPRDLKYILSNESKTVTHEYCYSTPKMSFPNNSSRYVDNEFFITKTPWEPNLYFSSRQSGLSVLRWCLYTRKQSYKQSNRSKRILSYPYRFSPHMPLDVYFVVDGPRRHVRVRQCSIYKCTCALVVV